MNTEEFQQLMQKTIDEIGKVFVTEDQSLVKKILCGFLAGGHILLRIIQGLEKPYW